MKPAELLISRRLDRESVAHVHCVFIRNEIMTLAAMWVEVDIVMLDKIS